MTAGRHEVTIGANTFYLRRYDPFLGLEILGDLQQRLGAPLLSSMEGRAGLGNEDAFSAMMSGLAKLSASMDGKALTSVARRLLLPDFVSVAANGGEPRKLDASAIALLNLGMEDLAELCVEVAKFQFGPFFERLRSLTGAVASQMQSLSGGFPTNSQPN